MPRLPLYVTEILDKNLTPITSVKGFYPLAHNGDEYLTYTNQLSDVGSCRFRVSTKDPIFDPKTGTGDIFIPYVNGVRISRGGVVIWQGVIVNLKHRNKQFVEVEAKSYMHLLDKVLVNNDVSVTSGDGKDNYRTLSSGTMATYITTILQETIAKVPASSPLKKMVIGTIENPQFPYNYVKADGRTPLTGAFTFSSDFTLQFDYRSVLYFLNAMGIYGNCDFSLEPTVGADGKTTLTFNFKSFLGNRTPQIMFEYGTYGTISDYDIPAHGDAMVNDLIGIAYDADGNILHANKSDSTSIATYGTIQSIAAFADVKNINALNTRLAETLRFASVPNPEINVDLNDKAYPVGVYGLGDVVTIKITDHFIKINEIRRIVGITSSIYLEGEEQISLYTNVPRSNQ